MYFAVPESNKTTARTNYPGVWKATKYCDSMGKKGHYGPRTSRMKKYACQTCKQGKLVRGSCSVCYSWGHSMGLRRLTKVQVMLHQL